VTAPSGTAWTAVVLAGGRGRRLGGVDKATLEVGGRALLARVLDSVPDAGHRVVVGPGPLPRGARAVLVREEPPGGGPVAALGAGLAAVRDPVVVVLACDLPFADGAPAVLVAALAAAGADADAAVARDADGRAQPLMAAYRRDTLARVLADLEPLQGRAMREVVARLRVRDVTASELPALALLDVDTPDDLATARQKEDGWTSG
jgi:molybdopterin-guanine dinucleotide biosynthesis protein A